jgi:hypothetical protein
VGFLRSHGSCSLNTLSLCTVTFAKHPCTHANKTLPHHSPHHTTPHHTPHRSEARAQQDAVRMASSFEAQLAELEAAADAADAAAAAGLSGLAADEERRRAAALGGAMLSEALSPDLDLDLGGDPGMSADLLELIGALEQDEAPGTSSGNESSSSNGSGNGNGSGSGSGSGSGGTSSSSAAGASAAAPGGDGGDTTAATAALEREVERLLKLQVGGFVRGEGGTANCAATTAESVVGVGKSEAGKCG